LSVKNSGMDLEKYVLTMCFISVDFPHLEHPIKTIEEPVLGIRSKANGLRSIDIVSPI
jgi:hypothetical protein